jgi:hypothetical protein
MIEDRANETTTDEDEEEKSLLEVIADIFFDAH